MSTKKYFIISLTVALVDQIAKLLVHYTMDMGEFGEIALLGDWFKLHYTLNEGMAFGFKLGSTYGKLILTSFRWLAMVTIAIYLFKFARKRIHPGFLWLVALILGGAIGNVMDSTFYGVWFDNAPLMESEPPLYPWFHGQVVDMIFFDVWHGSLPDWLPIIGGRYYSFWPIFNIADAAIFVGVSGIVLFQNFFFPAQANEEVTFEQNDIHFDKQIKN
ncbi:lipoprotein signal peptidase [Flammeovirgaceae bacterium SG7u.111]|nr:lipoprotein signal peptidase [Flammeovirgaceae bacterium SG7u.132]WPO35504.1 lipoprotein signal peptidase [Flammeovirgaceae bacterium SG7u.111]